MEPESCRETMRRHIEMQRMRDEMNMEELASSARRCALLEAELSRERMVERELVMHRGYYNGFPCSTLQAMMFDYSPFPLMGQILSMKSLEERVPISSLEERRRVGISHDYMKSLEERVPLSSLEEKGMVSLSHENGGSESLPFQRGSASALRISEVKHPFLNGGKEKEKTIMLVNPDANVSGLKRKAITLPGVDGGNKLLLDRVVKKKVEDEWSCALCQVSATSEQGLKDHLMGKKHKLKESSTFNTARKNVGQLTNGSKTASDGLVKSGDQSSKKENSHYWCEICKVGASSEKVRKTHERGKKHLKRLKVSKPDIKEPTDEY